MLEVLQQLNNRVATTDAFQFFAQYSEFSAPAGAPRASKPVCAPAISCAQRAAEHPHAPGRPNQESTHEHVRVCAARCHTPPAVLDMADAEPGFVDLTPYIAEDDSLLE